MKVRYIRKSLTNLHLLVKVVSLLLAFVICVVMFSGCLNTEDNDSDEIVVFTSFRDIPGLSPADIAQIEEIISRTDYFTYGMMLSTEAFLSENGDIGGFSVLMCEWLSELFGVEFIPAHFTWNELLDGLEQHTVDFSGNLTATPERRLIYTMTEPIGQRSVRYFRMTGSEPLSIIAAERLPRYALLEGAISAQRAVDYALDEFEVVYVAEYEEAYELLRSGEVDALLAESSAEAIFDVYKNIETSTFLPLIHSPVSFSTRNPELAPIVDAVQKAIENGANRHIDALYELGHQNYIRHKIKLRLTPEEIEFINTAPVIPFGAEYDNFPVSFYSERHNEWQGISIDVLAEIEKLTGLEFEINHDRNTELYELLLMLETGEIHMLSEVIPTNDRAEHFLFTQNSFIIEQSVLISREDHPNISIDRINSVRVGLPRGTAHADFFFAWFPNHPHTVIYDSQAAAFDALIGNEVDVTMNSFGTLLYLINYRELSGFKANYIFKNEFKSTYGINLEQPLLLSVVDKALDIIDTEIISQQWRNRTYDYRLRQAEQQRPWLVGISLLSLLVVVLVMLFLKKIVSNSKNLEGLVKERTKELALQTATLSTLFDSIPDLIWTKNKDEQYMLCNIAFLKNFGKKMEDLVGKTNVDGLNISAEIAEQNNEIDRRVMNSGNPVTIEEYIPSPDGNCPLYETTRVAMILDGAVIGTMGIAHDITNLKKMEQEIAVRYDYANKLSDTLALITKSPAISGGALITSADFITSVSCAALNVSGIGLWRMSEDGGYLKNISYFSSATGAGTLSDNFNLADHKEYTEQLNRKRLIVINNVEECKILRSDSGDAYGANLCAGLDAPIRVDGKLVGVICAEQEVCADYPDKRVWLLEEQNFVSSLADLIALAISGYERHKAQEEAEIANRSKSAFLANMSHEIRTPMNAILGVTEIMIQTEALPENIEIGLSKIYNSCDLLLGIINDILDFSKIEAGKLDIMPAEYKLASMVNDSVQLNMMRINSKPIEFELCIDENVPAKLIGDAIRIKQILNNLLSNAFKYTDSGKVTFTVAQEPQEGGGIYLFLSVRDTGCGMTENQLHLLFEEYSRFTNDSSSNIEGTGLGLAIVQRLVHLMEGDIKVESEPGAGSLFIVKLPQEKVDDEIIGKEVAENLKQFRLNFLEQKKHSQLFHELMPYGRVLVVDDVETNLYVAVGLLKLYRLQIETVMSGKETLEKIKAGNKYDIIFMDHMMPGMDGIEVTTRLRELGYSEPVVALTANAVSGQADMFLQNGFDDFISKPIDIRQLNAVLNRLVRDKQPHDVIEAARVQMKKKIPLEYNSEEPAQSSMLLESFIRDARNAYKILGELYAENDFENNEDALGKYTTLVHGMKSTLWNVGDKGLSEFARKLEAAGREQDTGFITAQTPDFLEKLSTLLLDIEKKWHVMNSEESGGGDEDIEKLCTKLNELKEICADYNRKGALDHIAGIKNCSKETKSVLDEIKNFVLNSDFDEAAEAAEAYSTILNAVEAKVSRLSGKEITGLDINKGLKRYSKDEATYLKVLRSYTGSLRALLGELDGVTADGLDDYRIKVHGIKGSSLDIFAAEIGALAAGLEDAAKSGNMEYIEKNNPAFLEAANKLAADLEKMLKIIDGENPKPKKAKPKPELLAKLLEACEIYDMDGADAAMEEIERYSYTDDGGLAEFLREKFDMMNFEQMIQKLTDLK